MQLEDVTANVAENFARLRQTTSDPSTDRPGEVGRSLAQMADRLEELGWSTSRSAIGKIETGHRKVEVGEAVTMARALRVPLSWLLRPWDGREEPVERFPLGQVILRTTPLAFGQARRRLYAAAPEWVLPEATEPYKELVERVMRAQDRANDARAELLDAVDNLFADPNDKGALADAEAAFKRLRQAVAALQREQANEHTAGSNEGDD